ncbi:MAG TPA: NAD(P)/FAD-dependent oxidoreductase [Streptosporangiaceae bacterium]|jgi:monoamine oxidase|nr:NAD(P)/FAD-dependent oxidoreductase [Streptosporangiaceae bacterium]
MGWEVVAVRTWGGSGAGAAIRRAQAVSAHARRTGCGVDEATEVVARPWSRRRFLWGAGAAAVTIPVATAAPVAAAPVPRSADRGRVVIVGAGIAGLGCAYRLWRRYGIRAEVYEYNTVPGGRIRTLRGYFDDGQIAEEHAEFINPEHTATLQLASNFGFRLDNCDRYPPGTHPLRETMRFGGRPWSQTALNRDWHEWGWQLFHRAAFSVAPWPQLYNHHNPGGLRFDRMSVTEWIDRHVPGGVASDFGALCVAAVLDEFGGPADEQSALNLVYLLGQDSSTRSGAQPHSTPQLGGGDEKWHVHGGNDQLITGLLDRLPGGVLHLGQKLAAVRPAGTGYVCTFECGADRRDVRADHVVLAMPFTTLRSVDLGRVAISPLHRRAIETEPLGTNSKFFLQFGSRVWNAEHTTANSYCGGLVQGGWDATVYQPGKPGILAALPGGEVGADWGPRYRLSGYRGRPPEAMVRAYLGGFDALFPGVSRAYNGRAYYVWSPGDPHILGAYSYFKPGQYTGFNGVQGQQEGNLHFAGEQTSMNFQGYIEGGLRSGYRCATEIGS